MSLQNFFINRFLKSRRAASLQLSPEQRLRQGRKFLSRDYSKPRPQIDVRADVMVALDVVGLIACLVILALYRQALPGEAVGIISTVAGIFGACLRDAHQFEFGSSRSSQAKDATISDMARR